MVKRKTRKVKSRKKARKAVKRTVRRKTTRKKAARKWRASSWKKPSWKASSKKMGTHAAAIAKNKKAHWAVYQELQKKADKAWAKLRHDVKRKAPNHVLLEDRNELLLLLGECHYLAAECMRSSAHHRS